jgi:hypothetical protein
MKRVCGDLVDVVLAFAGAFFTGGVAGFVPALVLGR